MAKVVLFVEDDPFTAEWTEKTVFERFGAAIQLLRMQSEKEFLVRFRELPELGPAFAAAIVDLLLPWEDGTILDGHPELIAAGDPAEAGTRIIQQLRNQFPQLPIMVHTVNDQQRQPMPEKLNTIYMRKDEPDERLLDWLNKACFRR